MRLHKPLLCITLLLPSLLHAQLPDLQGFWTSTQAPKEHPVGASLLALAPADAVFVDDAGAVEFPRGEYGGLIPKPEVLARAEEWTPAEEMLVENICKMPSIIYAMQGPFPMEIHQTGDVIVLQMEYFDMMRVVYLDGRGRPPAEKPHSKLGYSTGRWENGDLVVETTHIASATITNNGLDHSDDVFFMERFRRDGDVLWSTQYFRDPTNLENAGVRLMAWRLVEDDFVYPYDCDPFVYQQ